MTNAESKKIIAEQKERIAILEFHLGKLRDLLWLGYTNTSGIQTAPSPTKQRTNHANHL